MSKYTIPTDDYPKIVKIDSSDKDTLDFLLHVVTIWDNIIENIYMYNDIEVNRLYNELKLCRDKNPELSDRIRLRKDIILQKEKQKYYSEREHYIFCASADSAYEDRGISHLQLLRQIKAQALPYPGIGINSSLYDPLHYWPNAAPSKKSNREKAWRESIQWIEPNSKRLKPQPWEVKSADSGGEKFGQFVERNRSKLGFSVKVECINGNRKLYLADDQINNVSREIDIENILHNKVIVTHLEISTMQHETSIGDETTNMPEHDSNILTVDQSYFQVGLPFFAIGRSMTQEELDEVIKIAKYNGSLGERLVADYFESCLEQKIIRSYEWASQKNAISPYDFKFADNAGVNFLLDVKSTSGEFSSSMYISIRELMAMAQSSEQYDIYRVYNLTEKGGCLRIAEGMRDFAQSILNSLANLPEYARVDSFSIDIKKIAARFGKEIELYFDGNDEE